MSSRAARIRVEDFLIPPEFRAYRLAERSAGQVGGVRFALVESGGRTRVGPCYQQVPLRLLPAFHFEGESAALVYLINPTAGLMDGDGHLLEIEAGPGTCAVVTGQSANRIHPAVGSFATQQWRVRVAAGAQLVILPGPAIPFRGCRYFQHVAIELEAGAQLVWSDIWLPGRYAREALSEHHQFDRIVQRLEVSRAGSLVHRERFDWRGPWNSETARWHVGGDPTAACASMFVTGRPRAAAGEPTGALQQAMLPLASGDTLIRWCGAPERIVSQVVLTALRIAAQTSGSAHAPAWIVGSNHLGPSHWFSLPAAELDAARVSLA